MCTSHVSSPGLGTQPGTQLGEPGGAALRPHSPPDPILPLAACALPLPRVPGSHGSRSGPDSCPDPVRLFQMNVGPPKQLEELDPETREYWRLLRKHNIWRHNRLSKSRKF